MILTLSQQCKKINTTPDDFSHFCGVPKRTLNDWTTTKPLLLKRLCTAYLAQSFADDLTSPRQCTKTSLAQRNDIEPNKV